MPVAFTGTDIQRMAYVPILRVLLADRDHADVRSVWFNRDMYSNDRAQGVQMPRQSRLTRGYDRRATPWTKVCQVPPLLPELATAAAIVRSSSRVELFAHRPSVCIQGQQTRPVARHGRVAIGMDHPALRGTFCKSLTCTDARSCPKCRAFALLDSHVAPRADRVTDREQHRHIAYTRLSECFLAPFLPVDRVCGVLHKVRAC